MVGTSWSTETEKGTIISNAEPLESPPPPPSKQEKENTKLRQSRIQTYAKDTGSLSNLMKYACSGPGEEATRSDSLTVETSDAGDTYVAGGNGIEVRDEEKLKVFLEETDALLTGRE